MSKLPETKRGNGTGRDPATGRFLPGNSGGPGYPYARRVAELRSALLDAVTPADVREIAKTLVAAARGGDVHAAKEVLLRVLGRPVEADLLERLEALEQQLAERPQHGLREGSPQGQP